MAYLVPIILIVLLWVLVILPQQRRLKAHKAFVQTLAVGDEVITTAGLYGTVTSISDDRATLEIAPGVEVTTARFAIGERQDGTMGAPDDLVDGLVAGDTIDPPDIDTPPVEESADSDTANE